MTCARVHLSTYGNIVIVRRHLLVESQNLLACYDYDDDDSDQSSVDKFTMDDPDTGSESGVNNSSTSLHIGSLE
jgi:hypothetical protein